MKTRPVKKLKLNAETVRKLTTKDLRLVVGRGGYTPPILRNTQVNCVIPT